MARNGRKKDHFTVLFIFTQTIYTTLGTGMRAESAQDWIKSFLKRMKAMCAQNSTLDATVV